MVDSRNIEVAAELRTVVIVMPIDRLQGIETSNQGEQGNRGK
jgi:hypothetical protein